MAVLPFANLSGDPQQDYLSDGLTQEMIAQLGRLHPETLSVIARTSVMRYKKTETPIDQIGKELGVQYVLEGSAQREGSPGAGVGRADPGEGAGAALGGRVRAGDVGRPRAQSDVARRSPPRWRSSCCLPSKPASPAPIPSTPRRMRHTSRARSTGSR